MNVEISAQPHVVDGPRFAGLTVRVPLSSTPTRDWLDRLATQDLPGKGHRVVPDGIEFHLDRDSHDVAATMRKIADAIRIANQKDVSGEQDDEDRVASARGEADRQLASWWDTSQQRQQALERDSK